MPLNADTLILLSMDILYSPTLLYLVVLWAGQTSLGHVYMEMHLTESGICRCAFRLYGNNENTQMFHFEDSGK